MDRMRCRVSLLAGMLACFSALAGLLFWFGPHASFLPKCVFHRVSGWHCPGCGMTRAAHALMRGEWLEAFRYNPVLMILLPVAAAGGAWELWGWLRGRPMPIRCRVGRRMGCAVLGALLAFWFLRNLPYWPWTLLSPP